LGNRPQRAAESLHFTLILSHSYNREQQTDGTALTTFKTTASMPEKYLRAIEAGITHGVADTTNPRRGPYVLLCSTGDCSPSNGR